MSLIGSPLLLLTGAVALILPLVVWQRARRRTTSGGVSLVGLVVAAQVAALLFGAVALNDYGYFYGSWGELFGSARIGRITTAPAQAPTHRPAVTAVRVLPGRTSSPERWRRHGRIVRVEVSGGLTGLRNQALVYLPPEYFRRSWAGRRFPGVEVFTGYPSTDLSLVKVLHFSSILAHDLRAGRAGPMVLVMTTPSPAFPRDTECTDVPAGPQVLTYYAEDVPRAIASTFRVRASHWGAMGVSTGGYCAAKLAMTSPWQFPAAASLSGYYNALQDVTTGDLWGGSAQLRDMNDLDWRLEHLPAPPVSLLVTTGTGEGGKEGYAQTARFLRLARPPMRVFSMVAQGGAHNYRTWNTEIPAVLGWMSRRLGAGGSAPGTTASASGGPAPERVSSPVR
jgi:Putative esterase